MEKEMETTIVYGGYKGLGFRVPNFPTGLNCFKSWG